MKPLLSVLLLCASGCLAQARIPAGTIIPVQLRSSLNSRKTHAGQMLAARVMQDVPLSNNEKIRAGAKVVGRVISVRAATGSVPSQITFTFDRLDFAHKSSPISTHLRALASMMAVEDAQVPPTGPDRGTPWASATRTLIGGEVAYGDGGPVAHGTRIVGYALVDGVLTVPTANGDVGYAGELAGTAQPQAMWVFSSDACGVYGIPGLRIVEKGTTSSGRVTLVTTQGDVEARKGSGMLLRVNASPR